MPVPAEKSKVIRFGVFEVNPPEAELRKHGLRIKLQDQPFQILLMLLEHPGQTVSRDDLRQKLWPADTFVDFDHSLNSSIKKLREALGDDSENPRFIETLHRRGYRFIGPVELPYTPVVEGSEHSQSVASAPANVAPHPHAAGQPLQTSIPAVLAVARRHKLAVGAGVCATLIVLIAAVFGVYSLLHRPVPMPFRRFTITQVTNTGRATQAAVSPDGRYVLSVLDDDGLESVWLRNIPTGSDTQVTPPSATDYQNLYFSRDGNYFYFCRTEAGGTNPFVNYGYRSAVLGGTLQKMVAGCANAFSPDGQRVAYIRVNDPGVNKYRLVTASLDGKDETTLQTGLMSEGPTFLEWSPQGNEIFYSTGDTIDVLDVRTGKSRRFISFKDKIVGVMRWSPDGRALFANYKNKDAKGSPGQIGFIRPDGSDLEPITRDANTYDSLALSADGKTLTTIQRRSVATISVLSKIDRRFAEPQIIFSRASEFNDWSGLNWTPDGGLLVNDTIRLWKLAADGKRQTQLVADSSAGIHNPSPCGAKYLVMSWAFPGSTNSEGIWRINADGSSPVRLTEGKYDRFPVCSADEKWVYYSDWLENHIFRVPLDGSAKSEMVLLRFPQSYDFVFGQAEGGLVFSPDSKTLAAPFGDVGKPAPIKIGLFEPGSSNPPRVLDAPRFWSRGLQFTPDGKSIAYVIRANEVDNLWVQPLNGSAPYPITSFKSEQIWSFSLSQDGKKLALLRGHYDSDVVLLQESKP